MWYSKDWKVEKTLESPLDCKEIQPVHSKGDQSWVFFGRKDAKEIPGLISFRMDWLDLLAVQRTLKSLLQHHSSKASILRCSAFFTVQLSHPYMTTGKTIALTRQTAAMKLKDACSLEESESEVVSDSLQSHGLQHARPPCPSPTSRVYPNSCPLSQ